jgi:IS30 family transposase
MLAKIKKYMIEEKWAPHSISGRKKVSVCATTIYTYIDIREPSLKHYLKYKK